MSKKHGIHAGMPFSFNHNGENIVGKVTKVKETASGLEFVVEPIDSLVVAVVHNTSPFITKYDWFEFVRYQSNSSLEYSSKYSGVWVKRPDPTVKLRPSEIYDAISKKAKPDDSLMAKIFGAQSFIGDYPDINPKVSDFMIRGESLELHCEVCNKYFKPTKDLHYVVKSHTAMFMAPDVETFHDAYDCPRCGSQIIAKERASAAK